MIPNLPNVLVVIYIYQVLNNVYAVRAESHALLTNDSPSNSWNERFMAGTSAAHIPEAPALLPVPKGGTRSSFGSMEALLRWDTTVVDRLLRPMNETVCREK